jgi:hypothetical protein
MGEIRKKYAMPMKTRFTCFPFFILLSFAMPVLTWADLGPAKRLMAVSVPAAAVVAEAAISASPLAQVVAPAGTTGP